MAEEASPDSRERIMNATYRALIETGYANLTMSDIATESETSTSLLHYHFDTKEDLLVAFLDHVVDRLSGDFAENDGSDSVKRLYELLDLYALYPEETERESFHIALAEVRGEAPYNERYRERFRRADEILTEEMAEILREGIDRGVFGDTEDPDGFAQLLIAAADGARTKGIALGDPEYTRETLDELYDRILGDLLTEAGAARWEELAGD